MFLVISLNKGGDLQAFEERMIAIMSVLYIKAFGTIFKKLFLLSFIKWLRCRAV